MPHIFQIFRFVRPYATRYWKRLGLGILAGTAFGLLHASFVYFTNVLVQRLENNPIESVPTNAGDGWLASLQSSWAEGLDLLLPRLGEPLTPLTILGTLLILPFLVALRGGLGYSSNYLMAWVSERVARDLRCDLMRHLTTLSLDYFSRAKSGDLMVRMQQDTESVQTSVGSGLADLVKEPITIISITAMLLWIDPGLTLVGLAFIPLCLGPIVVLGRKMRKAAEQSIRKSSSQASLFLEFIAGIRIIKAFGLEAGQIRKFTEYANEVVHHNVKGVQSRETINPVIEQASAIGISLLILFVVWNEISLANLASLLMGVILFASPVKKLAKLYGLLKKTSVAVDRLQEVLHTRPSVLESDSGQSVQAFQDRIVFDHVTFSYGNTPVIHQLSLTIPKGTKLGIAGESGSGKSTFINLLFRFYDPTEGQISLDGIDFREVRTSDLRALMALVSQDTVLFDDSVAANIACGKKGASEKEIRAAAESAHATEFIEALPQKFDTLIGERGITLSGGQRQRLALARAFIRNAPILVLDEATASLDSASESEVQGALEELSQGRTVITIAHRLSTLKGCDRILVFDQGRIVEDGTFENLLQKGGHFSDAVQQQRLRL